MASDPVRRGMAETRIAELERQLAEYKALAEVWDRSAGVLLAAQTERDGLRRQLAESRLEQFATESLELKSYRRIFASLGSDGEDDRRFALRTAAQALVEMAERAEVLEAGRNAECWRVEKAEAAVAQAVEALKQAATALSNIRQYTTGLYASERNGTPSPKYFAMRLDNLADHGTRLRALLAERGIEC